QRTRDDALYDGPPTVRVYRRFDLAVDPPTDELALMNRVKTEALPLAEALAALSHDKLGGGAVWLHGDATPQSRTGGGPMRLVLQVTTDLVRFDITPAGRAYVFVDPVEAADGVGRLVWQGA